MIVRMKKVTMAVSNRDKEDFLNSLRKEGLIHIKHLTSPVSSELTLNAERVQRLEKAVSILESSPDVRGTQGLDSQFETEGEEKPVQQLDELGIVHVIQEIFTLEQQREDLEKDIQDEKNILLWYRQWGGFSLEDLLTLRKQGIYLKLYVLNKAEFKKIRGKENIFVIKIENGYFYTAGVFYKEDEGLPFNEVKIPVGSFNYVKIKFAEDSRKFKEVIKQLKEHAVFQKPLKDFAQNLEMKHRFLEVFLACRKKKIFHLSRDIARNLKSPE